MSAEPYDLSLLYGEREHGLRVGDPEEQRLYQLEGFHVPLEYCCHENPDVEAQMVQWRPLARISERQQATETSLRLSKWAGSLAGAALLVAAAITDRWEVVAYCTLGAVGIGLMVWIGVQGAAFARKEGE